MAEAESREIPYAVEVAGEVVPAAGRVAEVAAPVSGLAQARANLSAPTSGGRVRAGQTLAVLSPTSQDNSYAQAKARVERLEREVERLARLYEAEAIPEKRLVEARHDLEVARAALEAMGGAGGDGYDYPVRAPISGIVQSRRFTPGQRVEAGEMLFEIVIGQFATAQLEAGGTRSGVAIPSEAVQSEDGQPVAYVQTGGETFERCPLTLGPTGGFYTLVERGVEAGEHVVTEGAYQVYLASLSTTDIGDHGHPH